MRVKHLIIVFEQLFFPYCRNVRDKRICHRCCIYIYISVLSCLFALVATVLKWMRTLKQGWIHNFCAATVWFSFHGWLMQGRFVIICLFCLAWRVSGIDVKALFTNVPTSVTYHTGRQSEGFRNAPNWHQEIYGPNEFNKLSQGPIWHSGSVLRSTPAMSPLQHVSF